MWCLRFPWPSSLFLVSGRGSHPGSADETSAIGAARTPSPIGHQTRTTPRHLVLQPSYTSAREGAACTLVCRVTMSADVDDALLGFRLGSGLGLRGKREDGRLLPFIEPRQQHDVAIGELERVMIDVKRALVDLAKDCNGVAGIGSKHEGGPILDWLLARQFGTRKYADSHRTILRRGESSRAGAEVVCDEFFAHFGWACSHIVQTVVAHIKDLLSRKPPIAQC